MCFREAERDGQYKELLGKAEAYIRGNQWDESKDKKRSDFGYGGPMRPDLSNTAFALLALSYCQPPAE